MPTWSDRNRTAYHRSLTHSGETKHLAEWARSIGVTRHTLAARLLRMSIADALAMPLRPQVARHEDMSKEAQAKRRRLRNERARRARIDVIRTYKQSRACKDCRRVYHPDVMEFDHVRGKKLFNISDAPYHIAMERLAAEIAKCDLVCANCHRLRTATRRV
jgi:hypothetical protein